MDKHVNLKNGFVLMMASLFLWSGLLVSSAEANDFDVEVRVILASNSDQGFDPRLLDLKKDLLALNYMSFQLIDQSGLSLDKGATGKVDIPGKRILELTPTDFSQGKIRIKVRILEGSSVLLKSSLRIENNGTVILGGPPYESGFLALAVTAHY